MKEIELERTFLAKYIPEEVFDCVHREIFDLYMPASIENELVRYGYKKITF